MIDALLTAIVTILVFAGYAIAIFLCALVWRLLAGWVEDHLPRRRAPRVRRALVDVDIRRAARDVPVRSRRTLP